MKNSADVPLPPPATDAAEDDAPRRYAVPALEKGLEVLELFAASERPLSLTEVSQRLGRSPGELFRILSSLAERRWITKLPEGDAYQLTLRLHELATQFPPTRLLVDAARPLLTTLARDLQQSIHVSVVDRGDLLVLLETEAPGSTGVFVRQGSRFNLATTVSGRVLMAFQDPAVVAEWLAVASRLPDRRRGVPDLPARLAEIRRAGYEQTEGEWLHGVVDLAFPILGPDGAARAAVAIPFVGVFGAAGDAFETGRRRLGEAAAAITRAIGG